MATEPWKHFSLDFVTDLPVSLDDQGHRYDAVLVLVDRFTKYSRYLPVNKTITAQQLAELLMRQAFLKTGAPASLVIDRGSVFTSQFWSDICYYLKIQKHLSTAFHPQTDGQTERQNQEIESFLRIYMNREQDNWVALLPYAEYAYSSKKHAATGYSPIELSFGTRPTAFDGVPDEHWLRKPNPELWEGLAYGGQSADLRRQVIARLEQWYENWEYAAESLRRTQEQYWRWYNRKRQPAHFSPGDEVLLNRKNIASSKASKKFDCRYLGPFRVLKKVGKLAYLLDLPPSMAKIHPVFHISLLEPWRAPPESKGFRPGPVDVPDHDGAGHYEVERILCHKTVAGKQLFRVKWLGWPEEDSTWEEASNLTNCDKVLYKYWQSPRDVSRGRALPRAQKQRRG